MKCIIANLFSTSYHYSFQGHWNTFRIHTHNFISSIIPPPISAPKYIGKKSKFWIIFLSTNKGYGDTLQTGTTIKCGFPDTCYAIRNYNLCKASTAAESILTDTCHTIRNYDLCKTCTTAESSRSDICHTIRNYDLRKTCATAECIVADICYTIRNSEFGYQLIVQI